MGLQSEGKLPRGIGRAPVLCLTASDVDFLPDFDGVIHLDPALKPIRRPESDHFFHCTVSRLLKFAG